MNRVVLAVISILSARIALAAVGTYGYAGGQGGKPFYYDDPTGLAVSAVHVTYGSFLVALQVEYLDAKGQRLYGTRNGGQNGSVAVFTLQTGEYIAGIEGHAGMLVDSVRFVTNTGRRSPTYGGNGGKAYEIYAPRGEEIVGFIGRSGMAMDAVGIASRPRMAARKGEPPIQARPPTSAGHEPEPVLEQLRILGHAGSGGGIPFSCCDLIGSRVYAVHVVYEKYVLSVQMEYRDDNGRAIQGPSVGSIKGHHEFFYLEDGEYLTGIVGSAGLFVDSIRFVTSTGRSSPLYGGTGGAPYRFLAPPNTEVVGFDGSADNFLKKVGIVYRTRRGNAERAESNSR